MLLGWLIIIMNNHSTLQLTDCWSSSSDFNNKLLNPWPVVHCQNGGNCICWNTCLCVICHQCIEFPEGALEIKCPHCHLQGLKGKPYKVKTVLFFSSFKRPYIVLGQRLVFKGQFWTQESFPHCVLELLVIISMTLKGLANDGPLRPMFEHLVPYLRGNICYININTAILSLTLKCSHFWATWKPGQSLRVRWTPEVS